MTIPSGYQLHINSWENDGDNCKTEIISGLTKEDVKFYLHFLSHFYSQSSTNENKIGRGFGNMNMGESRENEERTAIESALKNCPPSSPDLIEQVKDSIDGWNEDPYEVYDWVRETIGYWDNDERYRVFDSFEVYYIPEDIPSVKYKFYRKNQTTFL